MTEAAHQTAAPSGRPSLTVIVLSFNRKDALDATLTYLQSNADLAGAQILVVDNGSGDGSPAMVAQRHPTVELIALSQNRGVAAFNAAARAARGQALLVLDDDAWPEPGVVALALDLLARRPELAAITLHPRHPRTRASEWPFGDPPPAAAGLDGIADRWPVMGCGNIVRRDAWMRAGGYDEAFFLYRNDTDLAMKLHGLGLGVHFNPEWVVWHDSPAAARKSKRWFRLATRNWVWLCRRHGSGASGVAALLAGWLHAHALAGRSPADHLAVARGALSGLLGPMPACPAGAADARGSSIRDLLALRRAARRHRR